MRGRGSMVRVAVAIVAVVLLGAACAEENGSDAGASGPTDADASGTTAEATGSTGTTGDDATDSAGGGGGGNRYDYGGGSGDDGGGGAGGDADLSADNFAFSPGTIEVPAGTELVVENASGSTPHTFTVDGTDVDLELDPGDVEDVTIDLDPGTYTFLCRFHPQMTGTLTVV